MIPSLIASLALASTLHGATPRPATADVLHLDEIESYIVSKLAYDEDYFAEILRLEKQGRVHPRLSRTEMESESKRARANHPVLERFSSEKKAAAPRYSLPQNSEIHREYTNLMGILNMMNAWRAGDAPGVLSQGGRLQVRKKEDFGHVRGDASRFYLAMYRLYFFLMAAAHYSSGQDAQSVEWVARLEGEETVKSLKQRLTLPLADPQAARELHLEVLRSRPMAVMPFDVMGADASLAWAPPALQQVLTTDLTRGSDLFLVERGALDKVMDEAALGAAGFTDDKKARDLGKLMGAGTLLLGSLQRLPKGVLLSARLVDGEDARVLSSTSVTVTEDELFSGARRAVSDLIHGLNWDASLSVESINAAPPPRVATVKELHQARLSLAGNRAQSRELFAQAMRSDPGVANLFGDLAREFPNVTARIAVLDIQNLSGAAAEDWMARGVVEALGTDLPRIGFSVVERGQLDEVVTARATRGAVLDAAGAQELGKLLSADFVVMGSVLHQRPMVRLDVRFVDVRTGVVAHAVSAENARDDFMAALTGLLASLGEHFNRSLDEKSLQQLVGARQNTQQYESFIRAELARDALRAQKKGPEKQKEAEAVKLAAAKAPVTFKDRARPVMWVAAGLAVASATVGALVGGAMVLLGAVLASQADAQANQYQGMLLLAASGSADELRTSRDSAALRANIFKVVAWTGGALCGAALLVFLGGGGVVLAERLW